MEGFGVEDVVGEILGGKLVGREVELADIETLLNSEEPGTPTILVITGEPGVGRGALMGEAAARLLGRGGRALEIDLGSTTSLVEQINVLLGTSVVERAEHQHDSISKLTASLLELAHEGPILLTASGEPDRASVNYLRSLARYMWALSLERASASRVLITIRDEANEDPFQRTVHLAPLSEEECDALIQGTLGAANLQSELIARLHALSGGNSGALRSVLASLIEDGFLRRRDGAWAFREAIQIHSIGAGTSANPWVIAWKHLDDVGRRTLLTLTLFRRPIPTSQLDNYLPGVEVANVLSTLRSRGWVRESREGWLPASGGVRQAVQELASTGRQAEAAGSILRAALWAEGEEEIVDIELRHRPGPKVLQRGVEFAERALARGDQRLATERLRLCYRITQEARLWSHAQSICLRMGSLLHQLGDEGEAQKFLEDECWRIEPSDNTDAALRLHLLGQIATVRGDLDAARRLFAEAIALAGGIGAKAVLLRCHADLAEIDWRHGDEALRGQAIKRLETVLVEYPPDPTLRDERAALMYQLGAATVVSGASREAIETLRAGFDLAESDYWRMRLANALSSAHHYVGDPQAGLKWLDEAWRLAESSGSDSFKARILSNRGGLYVIKGNFAEGADQDRLSALWARRFGNAFEYAAGRAGSAICAVHLARYEDALVDARETRGAAQTLNNYTYLVKSYEIEGLVYHAIGKNDLAETGVSQALAVCQKHGYTVVKPRLEWLLAKILKERGQGEASEKLLRTAEAQLLETRDLEDLWGVQIEMSLGLSSNGRAEASMDEIEAVFRKAEERGLLVVTIPAALAISEILHEERLDHIKYKSLMGAGLQMAEGCGMRELAWRLSFRMGALAAREGQRKEAYSRFTLASRLIREIAGELSDDNRDVYMRSFHVTSALKQMAPALSN